MTEDFVQWMRETATNYQGKHREKIKLCVEEIIKRGGTSFAALETMLQDPREKTMNRITIVILLAQNDTKYITPVLISMLATEPNDHIREQIIIELGQLQATDAFDVLRNLLTADGNKFIRLAAADALGQIDIDRAADDLCVILADFREDAMFRRYIAQCMIRLDVNEKIITALLHMLDDDDPMGRAGAIAVLGEIGDLSTIPLLQPFLTDKSSVVRWEITVSDLVRDAIRLIQARHST